MLFFLVTPCLVVAVKPHVGWISIKKNLNIKKYRILSSSDFYKIFFKIFKTWKMHGRSKQIYTNMFSNSKGVPTIDPSFLIHSLQSGTRHPNILYPPTVVMQHILGVIFNHLPFFLRLTTLKNKFFWKLKLKQNKSREQEGVWV